MIGRPKTASHFSAIMLGMAAEQDASAGVAELVDALDLGSSDESCGGSSPSARTILFARAAPESACAVSSTLLLAGARGGNQGAEKRPADPCSRICPSFDLPNSSIARQPVCSGWRGWPCVGPEGPVAAWKPYRAPDVPDG